MNAYHFHSGNATPLNAGRRRSANGNAGQPHADSPVDESAPDSCELRSLAAFDNGNGSHSTFPLTQISRTLSDSSQPYPAESAKSSVLAQVDSKSTSDRSLESTGDLAEPDYRLSRGRVVPLSRDFIERRPESYGQQFTEPDTRVGGSSSHLTISSENSRPNEGQELGSSAQSPRNRVREVTGCLPSTTSTGKQAWSTHTGNQARPKSADVQQPLGDESTEANSHSQHQSTDTSHTDPFHMLAGNPNRLTWVKEYYEKWKHLRSEERATCICSMLLILGTIITGFFIFKFHGKGRETFVKRAFLCGVLICMGASGTMMIAVRRNLGEVLFTMTMFLVLGIFIGGYLDVLGYGVAKSSSS
jgi:hypothetical protein